MLRLSANALGSEQDAKFAIKELLPVLSIDAAEQALEIILEDYKKFKEEETKWLRQLNLETFYHMKRQQ